MEDPAKSYASVFDQFSRAQCFDQCLGNGQGRREKEGIHQSERDNGLPEEEKSSDGKH
jgi:hypothetical protein